MDTDYLQKLQIQNILSTNPNLVNNPFNPDYVNYNNMFSEVTLARLLAAHPYIGSLFMGGLTNNSSSSGVAGSGESNVQASGSSSLPSPSTSLATSTIFNRRNVNVSIEDFREIDMEGQKLPSVVVGGEPRVPMIFLLSFVLAKFNTDTTKDVMAEHSIRPVDCTDLELALLRAKVSMLANIQKCQVISRTSAEFIARTLIHDKGKSIARTEVVEVRPGVRVKGRVFGKQRGFFRSDLYVTPDAQCIECDSCGTYFAPEKFVGHTHQPEMRGLVHWGYKPSEWRRYLFFFRDKKNRDITSEDERRQRQLFADLINRFGPPPKTAIIPKRKMILSSSGASSSASIVSGSSSGTAKILDPLRKRPHVKIEAEGESPPLKRAMQRDALSEVVKRASSAQQQQDAIYAPNINLGSIPNATKSAFTPIDRRESKEFNFLLKETSMIDRLKKQYQVIKQTLETLDISNALKQSLMVEWTNLNQGYSSLYSSMKSRLEDARQLEDTLEKLNISQAEMIHLRTENKDLQLQLRICSEELEELKKKGPCQREPLPVRDRILYQNAKKDLEKSRLQLDSIQQQRKVLQEENEALRQQLKALKGEASPEPQLPAPKEANDESALDLEPPKELKEEEEEEDAEEVDSAATESAPGSSQPQSPGSPSSPFDVDPTIYRPLAVKHEAIGPHPGGEEDEYGPPTLTREQD